MRLQHLFTTEKTIKCIRWHHDKILVKCQLSHPGDEMNGKNLIEDFNNFRKRVGMLDSDSVLMHLTPFTINALGSRRFQ